ncbi:helix-turn-helix domain-containing protein, partial [Streptomyces albidoflavus]
APRTGSAPLPEVPAEVFAPVGAGGLGRTAERSWRHLAAAGAQGAALDEVSAAAGYQPATVTRHLEGLAERGLARLDGERWYAVTPQGAPAPA